MPTGMRGAMGIASQILIAGSVLLLFFIILSGVSDSLPLNKTYFLQADTSSILGSGRDVSRWTYFYICGAGNKNCGKPVPAMPFGYAWVGDSTGAPDALVGSLGRHTTSKYYYYMWRFAWVFYLLALIFDIMALFTSLLAPCSRLASGLAAFVLSGALFFMSFAAALMTVTFVKARNEFHSAGLSASLGKYAFGFTWGAWAAMFLATLMLVMGCMSGRERSRPSSSSAGKWQIFRRSRSTRSTKRGSFVETDSHHRVKDDYS